MITEIFDAIKEPLEALGRWVNADRRREARKDEALLAAEELIKIFQGTEPYDDMPDVKKRKYRVHFMKRFNAWKHG